MDKEKENEITEMYDSGIGIGAISQEMELSVTAVRNVLRKYDRPTYSPRPLFDEDTIVNMYAEGIPVPKILNEHGITYSHLYSILSRHEIPTRKVATAKSRILRMEIAVEMYKDGALLWQIANETGIAQPTLHAELHRRAVPLRRRLTRPGKPVESNGTLQAETDE